MRWKLFAALAVVGSQHCLAQPVVAQSNAIAWGFDPYGQCTVPALPPGVSYTEIGAGRHHSVALRSDGTVVAWGDNSNGQCNVPSLPAGVNYVEIAAGGFHSLARRDDGVVLAWGWNGYNQCNVPALPVGISFSEIAAGSLNSVARLSNGSVVAWGNNWYGQLQVPALPPGVVYKEVSAGAYHMVALRSDSQAIAWGNNGFSQCNVPALPAGLSYVQAAAGGWFTTARRSDGTVVAWGQNNFGQCNVLTLPAGLSYVQLAAGESHLLARRSDGSAVAWGLNSYGQCNVPVLAPGMGYADIAVGDHHNLARIACIQPAPSAPTALVASGVLQTGIDLSWTDNSSNEEGFSIERALAGSGSWFGIGGTPPDIAFFQDTTAVCGLYYDYRVSASNCGGSSGFAQAMGETCYPPPATYCTAKFNSVGCTPAIGWTGSPGVSGPIDDFFVTASNVLNQSPGILIWSMQSGSSPLGGGTLCLAAPLTRTPGQSSGGNSTPPPDCSGQYSLHFSHAYIQNHFLAPGQNVHAQYWSRDPGFLAPNDIGLTEGLSFTLLP